MKKKQMKKTKDEQNIAPKPTELICLQISNSRHLYRCKNKNRSKITYYRDKNGKHVPVL